MTIVTQRASKTNGAGNKICPSSLTTCRSNVVVSSLEEMIITVTICMLLLGLKDTDDTCSDDWPSLWLRSKVIVGFSALWSAGKLTTHGEERPPYFWNSTEELSFVTVTLSSGMIGSLPSWPMRSCDAQTTVVVVPAVVAIVVTGARVVVAGAVEAVGVVGGTEVDGVMPSGVDAAAVVVPAAAVVFGVTIVVISALKQPWMLGLTVYTPMPESTGSSMTIVTQRASKTNGAGNKICPSSLTTCRSNVVVSSLEEMIITVTICMLLLGLKDTDDTCSDGWPSYHPRRGRTTVLLELNGRAVLRHSDFVEWNERFATILAHEVFRCTNNCCRGSCSRRNCSNRGQGRRRRRRGSGSRSWRHRSGRGYAFRC